MSTAPDSSTLLYKLISPHCDFAVNPPYIRSPSRLINHLDQSLSDNPSDVEQFVADVQSCCEDVGTLNAWLAIDDSRSNSFNQNSLFGCLLAVSSIQPQLESWLIECLATEGEEWVRELNLGPSDSLPVRHVVRRILNTVSECDVHYDGNGLASKCVEVLDSCDNIVARELILALPSMVPSLYHPLLSERLIAMIKDAQSWSSNALPILDALSSLDLPPQSLDSVLDIVVHRFQTLKPSELPVVIRFLANAARDSKEQTLKFAKAIRNQLTLNQKALSVANGRDDSRTANNDASVPMLIATQLRHAFEQSTSLVKHLIESIGTSSSVTEHEFAVLCLLNASVASESSAHRNVIAVISSSASESRLIPQTVESSVMNHSAAFHSLFDSLTALCFELSQLKQGQEKIAAVSRTFYASLFAVFNNNSQRRKIVSSIIEHAQSDGKLERLHGLQCLDLLASHDASLLQPFETQLRSLTHGIDAFTLSEARIIARVETSACIRLEHNRPAAAAGLSQRSRSSSSQLIVEQHLMVFMRKLLFGVYENQRIGMVFVVAAVERIARLHESAQVSFSKSTKEIVHNIFMLMADAYANHIDLLAFTLDEFSRSLAAHPAAYAREDSLTCELGAHRARMESDIYLAPVSTMTSDYGETELRLAPYSKIHDSGDYTDHMVNIAPLLLAPDADQIFLLAPLVKFACTQERSVHAGSLGEVAGLVYAPVALIAPPENSEMLLPEYTLSLSRTAQIAVISCLIHAINWQREVISQFVESAGMLRSLDPDSSQALQGPEAESHQIDNLDQILVHRLNSLMGLEADLREICSKVEPIPTEQLLGFAGTTSVESVERQTRLISSIQPSDKSQAYTKLQRKLTAPKESAKRKAKSRGSSSDEDSEEEARPKKKKRDASSSKSSAGNTSKWFEHDIEPLLRPSSLYCLHLLRTKPSQRLKEIEARGRKSPTPPASDVEERFTLSPRSVRYLIETVLLIHSRAILLPSTISPFLSARKAAAVIQLNESKLSPLEFLRYLTTLAPSIAFYFDVIVAKQKSDRSDNLVPVPDGEETNMNSWLSTASIEYIDCIFQRLMEFLKIVINSDMVTGDELCSRMLESFLLDLNAPDSGDRSVSPWARLFHLIRSGLVCLNDVESIVSALSLLATCIDRGQLGAQEQEKLLSLAHKLLASDWTGPKLSKCLGTVIAIQARFSTDPLATMEKLGKSILLLTTQQEQSNEFGDFFTVKKAPMLLIPLMDQFWSMFSSFTLAVLTPSKAQKQFVQWDIEPKALGDSFVAFANLFRDILAASREFPENDRLLAKCLDVGVKYLKQCTTAFPDMCAIWFADVMKLNADSITRRVADTTVRKLEMFVSPLQKVTRSLLIIAEHGSTRQSSSMLRYGPWVKRVCEAWIWLVKQQARKLKVDEAFSSGTLRLRDIKGNELASQRDPDEPRARAPKRKKAKREQSSSSERDSENDIETDQSE